MPLYTIHIHTHLQSTWSLKKTSSKTSEWLISMGIPRVVQENTHDTHWFEGAKWPCRPKPLGPLQDSNGPLKMVHTSKIAILVGKSSLIINHQSVWFFLVFPKFSDFFPNGCGSELVALMSSGFQDFLEQGVPHNSCFPMENPFLKWIIG